MLIHTCGDPDAPAIVLLHPMLLSGPQMLELLGKRIPGGFFLIAPDQAGHGGDPAESFSPQRDAEELFRFLSTQKINRVGLLFAASMGGVTAMELLKRDGLYFKAVHLDGVPLAGQGSIKQLLAPHIMLHNWKKTKKDPDVTSGPLSGLYGDELAKSMADQFSRLTRNQVRQIICACTAGCAVQLEEGRIGTLTFEWGENESGLRTGKPLAEALYPRARILVRKGLGHCEYLAREPEAYARELCREIETAEGTGHV